MSWLSDLSRTFTGQGVGANIGQGVGYVVSGGNPAGAAAGARIGDTLSSAIDRDGSEGQATARSVNQNLPQESGISGNRMINPYMNDAGTSPQQAFIGPALTAFGRGALQQGSRMLSLTGS